MVSMAWFKRIALALDKSISKPNDGSAMSVGPRSRSLLARCTVARRSECSSQPQTTPEKRASTQVRFKASAFALSTDANSRPFCATLDSA